MFLVSHFVGDFVLQTEWQALHKRGGLGFDPIARRALLAHVATYALAYVPAIVWLAGDLGLGVLGLPALIFGPHLVQDDGRLIDTYMRRVKKADPREHPALTVAVDQTFHMVALLGVALLAASYT